MGEKKKTKSTKNKQTKSHQCYHLITGRKYSFLLKNFNRVHLYLTHKNHRDLNKLDILLENRGCGYHLLQETCVYQQRFGKLHEISTTVRSLETTEINQRQEWSTPVDERFS